MISSHVMAAECGPVTSMSIVGDHDTDWVVGAFIKLKSSFVRITSANSSYLTEDLTNLVISGDDDYDTKGYFICLDRFETYRKNRMKFARVFEYRIWKSGKFIRSYKD